MKQRSRHYDRNMLTALDRSRLAREREALVGSIITQHPFRGALVVEHVRGSQYLIRMPDGEELFVSHKKQNFKKEDGTAISSTGWRLWENRRYKVVTL